jgi:thioredoxin 2
MTEPLSIRWSNCGAINRVPQEKLEQGLEPICGRCKTPPPVRNKPTRISRLRSSARRCRSCSICGRHNAGPAAWLRPLWISWRPRWRVVFGWPKLNVDENPRTAERFQIRGIPALLVLKAGREVDRIVGAQPKSEIVRRLEQAIAGSRKANLPTVRPPRKKSIVFRS